MGWPPGGAARIADIVAQGKGFEAMLCCLEVTKGLLAGAAQIPKGLVCHREYVDWRELAGTHQPCEWDGITPVGFHAIARLLGNQGGCDDPIAVTLFRQIAIEPIAAGAGLVDKHQELAFREEPSDQFVELVLSGSNGVTEFALPGL
jgi:hypothetical protein